MRPALIPALLLACAAPFALHAQAAAPGAAPADSARPQVDKARDAARHPAEALAFAGIKAGDRVADFLMGDGYWTRILAGAVGPNGHVYAYQPGEFIRYWPNYGEQQNAAVKGYANVTPVNQQLADISFPEPLDAIVSFQNYHELHLGFARPGLASAALQKLFAALKPGGVLLVVDYAGNSDPGLATTDRLLRADPAAVRAEVEKAGFVFDSESPLLHNPNDKHTQIAYDSTIAGGADQFVYKFRKPN